MSFEAIAHDIAETIQKEANVQAVFGQPLKLDERTVVPVAVIKVSLGGGGGGTFLSKVAEKASPGGAGGGGGLDVLAVPVGFLSEKDGEVVFTRIEVEDEPEEEVAAGILERVLARRSGR